MGLRKTFWASLGAVIAGVLSWVPGVPGTPDITLTLRYSSPPSAGAPRLLRLRVPVYPGSKRTPLRFPLGLVDMQPLSPYAREGRSATYVANAREPQVMAWFKSYFATIGKSVEASAAPGNGAGITEQSLTFADTPVSQQNISLTFYREPSGRTIYAYYGAYVNVPPRPAWSRVPPLVRAVGTVTSEAWGSQPVDVTTQPMLNRLQRALNALTSVSADGAWCALRVTNTATLTLYPRRGRPFRTDIVSGCDVRVGSVVLADYTRPQRLWSAVSLLVTFSNG